MLEDREQSAGVLPGRPIDDRIGCLLREHRDQLPPGSTIAVQYLRRLGEPTWGERTTVVHTPTDDSALRRTGLVLLCQLELNFQPGMAAQGAGPWSETYGKYLRTRNEILRGIRPADPMVPRAVPYTPARDRGAWGRR